MAARQRGRDRLGNAVVFKGSLMVKRVSIIYHKKLEFTVKEREQNSIGLSPDIHFNKRKEG